MVEKDTTVLTAKNIKGYLNFNKNGYPFLSTKIGDNKVFFQLNSKKYAKELKELESKSIEIDGLYTVNDKGYFSLVLLNEPREIENFNNGNKTEITGNVFFVNVKEHDTKDGRKFYSGAISFKYDKDKFSYLNLLSKDKIEQNKLYTINSYFKTKINPKTKKTVLYLNLTEVKEYEKKEKGVDKVQEKKEPENEQPKEESENKKRKKKENKEKEFEEIPF